MYKLLVSLFATCVFISGCTSEGDRVASKPGLTKVILMTDWYPQPEHGGFYQALAKGFYEQEGLEVEIRSGASIKDLRPIVALGQVDFGVGTTDTTIIGAGRGVPLVGLFPYFQQDPQCVMFHPGNDIETLYDLHKREVMLLVVIISRFASAAAAQRNGIYQQSENHFDQGDHTVFA